MKRRRKVLVGVAVPLAFAALSLAICPKPDLYGDTPFSAAVVDRDGELLRLALAEDQRYRLRGRLQDVSTTAVEATLLYEDRYFYRHPGFNAASLVRAAWSTYILRRRPIGASTITMQLARMRFGLNTRSIAGKLSQIARAIQLERHYSKDEILEAYLNLAPYGGNIEGIATAALVYFDKPAAKLTMPEALALAVIPQNPVGRDPTRKAGHREMLSARGRLLKTWHARESIDDDTLGQFELPLALRSTSELPFHAPHFSQHVLRNAERAEGFLDTTLDLDLQRLLERQVEKYVERHRSRGIHNASALLVDHRTRNIVASIGSADFFDRTIEGQVDGTLAKRSPGSTLKPFVYGLAIDQGLIHPSSLLKDAPMRFAAYTPENFDRGFMGPIKAKDALIYSRNVPAIELLARLGHDRFHDYLIKAGVSGLASADHYGLAMVLGGNELSMRELVTQYAMLANGGVLQPLRSRRGSPALSGSQLLSREASFLVLDMLADNPRPGRIDGLGQRERTAIAWKTGTSYAFRDAWSVGVFGPYVLAVWVGNFDGSANPAFVGRSAAAPLFFETADALLADVDDRSWRHRSPKHLKLARIDVCADTGDLPGRYCPRTEKAWFIPGVSPIRVSRVHRAVRVDARSGRRACPGHARETRNEVYEFWPSDILAVFRQAGISIRQPPAWDDDCDISLARTAGLAPTIRSPSSNVTYQVRVEHLDNQRLAFAATTDSDVSQLFWFVNDKFVAAARGGETVFWRPAPGVHRVLAVDDLGRSHSREFRVRAAL